MSEPQLQLDQLERSIQVWRVEFERYFSGAIDIPPEELSQRIRSQMQRLRQVSKDIAESFRLSSLEARFNSYSELYNRRLRDVEEGRTAKHAPTIRADDAREGIVADDDNLRSAAETLYQDLYGQAPKDRRADLERFVEYLQGKHRMIAQRTGCEKVLFRIAEVDGELKLKARPMKDSYGSE